MTTASANRYRTAPFAAQRRFNPWMYRRAGARRHGARARAFATCYLTGASTLCPSRRR